MTSSSRRTRSSPACGSITSARRKKAGVSFTELVPMATVRGTVSNAFTVLPARRAAAVVTFGNTVSTGTVTAGGRRPSRRTRASASSARPVTLGSILAPAGRQRQRGVLRLCGDACVEVCLQPLQLPRLEVEPQGHDLRVPEPEPAAEPGEQTRPVGVVERLCDPRLGAEESAGHRHGDVALGVAERDRAHPLSARRRLDGGGRLGLGHTADVDTTDDGAGGERVPLREREHARHNRDHGCDCAQAEEDDERSPLTAGAGGSGEVHTDDVGHREAPEPRRSPSRRLRVPHALGRPRGRRIYNRRR